MRIVVLGGSGDAYLVSALMGAFKRHHGRDAEIVLRQRIAPVADLFGVHYVVDDALVTQAEQDHGFQATYENHFGGASPYYAHPCFIRSPVRIDKLTTKPDVSQADMYRMILCLPHDAPLDLPTPPAVAKESGTVVMLTDSTSWPNTQPEFWPMLAEALRAAGWQVAMNDMCWSLAELLARCTAAEWVIGPQCGVTSIMVTGQFPCRKTLATPNIDGNRRPEYLAAETFPYAYVTKFANQDHDVEEFKISDDNHAEIVDLIVNGQNARRLWPHNPAPVKSISMPLTPGDFLDRLAVLTVKRELFRPERRAAIEREYQRHAEARRQANLGAEADGMFDALVDLHRANFKLLERMVPAALEAGMGADDHVAAVKSNQERARIKRAIDLACRAPYCEIKSYHGSGENR